MGGWSGEGKDTIKWDGNIKAKKFIGDGSLVTGITETDPLSLHLDQTTPQTITGGAPIFGAGLISWGSTTFKSLGGFIVTAWLDNSGNFYIPQLYDTSENKFFEVQNRQIIKQDGTTIAFDAQNLKFPTLTTNGFLKTSGSDGTLSVDTATYLTAEADTLASVIGRGDNVNDNVAINFGTADDASITFDGNSLNIVANAVTSTDKLIMTGASYDWTSTGDGGQQLNLAYSSAGNTWQFNTSSASRGIEFLSNSVSRFNIDDANQGLFTFGAGVADTDITFTFTGTTNSGTFSWQEDEDYFKFSDNVNVDTLTASKVVFTNASKTLTSTGIGTSNQYIMGDGSLGAGDSPTLTLTAGTPSTFYCEIEIQSSLSGYQNFLVYISKTQYGAYDTEDTSAITAVTGRVYNPWALNYIRYVTTNSSGYAKVKAETGVGGGTYYLHVVANDKIYTTTWTNQEEP
jgi:hypothetical protein